MTRNRKPWRSTCNRNCHIPRSLRDTGDACIPRPRRWPITRSSSITPSAHGYLLSSEIAMTSMEIVLTSLAFIVSALLAGVMGFAIQRGATCTVAAMDEIVSKRRFHRLASMVEASAWVAGGLLIAQTLHLLGKMPAGYAPSYATVLGGMLLGLGAYVNRACVFGAIALLGSGQWAYVLTPVGFYAGCVTFPYVFHVAAQEKLPYGSPVLQASSWVAVVFIGFV